MRMLGNFEGHGDALQPISFHCLPVDVTLDFVKALQVRHVVDFTPTPLPLALELAKLGVSYFGVCGTEEQRTFINNALHNGLVAELQWPASPLHDPRIAPQPAAAPTPPPAAAPAPGPPLNLPSVGGKGTTNDGDLGGELDPAALAPPRGHGGPSLKLRWPLPLGSASDRHVLLIDLTI